MVVIGNDAARGGWAWCIADEEGPIVAGWVAVGHLKSPWVSLGRYLAEVYLPQVRGALLMGPVAVLVEEPGLQVGRVNRRRREGDAREAAGQARGSDGAGAAGKIAFGQGLAVGPVLAAVGGLGIEPETVTPGQWRKHWSIKGNRDECKAQAILLVSRLFPGLIVGVAGWAGGMDVAPVPWARLTDDQRSDVSEAVLIAVGGAQQKTRSVGARRLQSLSRGVTVSKPAPQRVAPRGRE